jgi:hypothetical protein
MLLYFYIVKSSTAVYDIGYKIILNREWPGGIRNKRSANTSRHSVNLLLEYKCSTVTDNINDQSPGGVSHITLAYSLLMLLALPFSTTIIKFMGSSWS